MATLVMASKVWHTAATAPTYSQLYLIRMGYNSEYYLTHYLVLHYIMNVLALLKLASGRLLVYMHLRRGSQCSFANCFMVAAP